MGAASAKAWRERNPERAKEYARIWRINNPEKHKAIRARTREKHRISIRSKYRKWWSKNKEVARAATRRWLKNNRDYYNKYRRNRRVSNVNCRLAERLRGRLRDTIKNNRKSGSALVFLGCSIDDFKLYLESKFESGMSWENYGVMGWHIDHIMPCAIFDLSNPEHQKRCFHFSNMQPMWAEKNWSKHKTFSRAQKLLDQGVNQ